MSRTIGFTSVPQNLQELWLLWLGALRSDGKVLPDGRIATNADRSPSDRLNYERALKDFARESTGAENLKDAPLTLLALEEDRILDTMIRGTTSRKGIAPSKHLEGSLRSWMRRLLTDMAFCLAHKSLRPQPGHKLWKPYRTPLKPFPTANWPENFRREFDVLESNYANRFYTGPGRDALKRHRMRPNTWKNYRRAVNRIVEYCLTVEHLQSMTLFDLIDYDRLCKIREWYFARKSRGGYATFTLLCMAVAAVARYLEIIGKLSSGFEPFSKLPDAPWMKFYTLADETEKDGHELGTVDKLPALPPLPPHEMEALACKLSTGLPRRANGRPSPYQIFRHRQAAVFYGMAAGSPVRIKNWVGMRWGHNLYQDAQGAWCVYFRPEELKNGNRTKIPREYKVRLPSSKAKWVNWWREQLCTSIGNDFEIICPYVFPARAQILNHDGTVIWKQGEEGSFYRLVRNSCLEVRGHAYRPHAIRSDVTEYTLGRRDANMRSVLQVAMLLGDSERTVLKSYNKPDVQAMLDEDYFVDISVNG